MIKLRNFSLQVGGKTLLREVEFDAKRGEWVALLGPSGAGKSTFLRCLQGFGGGEGQAQIFFGGHWHELADKKLDHLLLRRKVALLHQVPQLFPFSIRKNFLLPMKLLLSLSARDGEERMEFFLQKIGLWDELHSRLQSSALALSVGQQQRLALAQRLCLEPDMLLLDEPTAALDAHSASVMLEALKNMDVTKVMVSHHPAQLKGFADSYYRIEGGCLKKLTEARG